MTLVQELRQQVNKLTDGEKAALAADLLESLPPILDDEDEGLAEAQRRDKELDGNPDIAISWEQLRREIGR